MNSHEIKSVLTCLEDVPVEVYLNYNHKESRNTRAWFLSLSGGDQLHGINLHGNYCATGFITANI